MTLSDRWRRLDASRWVSWVLVLCVVFSAWQTLRVAFFGWLGGAAWLALVPGVFAVGAGLLLAAWRRDRPWAWFVLVVLVALQLLAFGGPLLFGEVRLSGVLGSTVSVVLLVLLLHPDSRAVVSTAPEPARAPTWRGPY
jgi:hypothetical protein